MQLRIYILRQRLPSLLWLLILLQKSPVVQTLSKVPALFTRAPFLSSAFLKKALPVLSGAVSFHALSGATTFVTSDDDNPASGVPGDDFEFGFFTGGANFAFSYNVEDLPGTLSFNEDAFGPLITGTLPDAGTYTITITGYRFAGLSGNSTPAYELTLVVGESDTTAPVITLVGSSTVTLTVGGTYTESGATATDETDGNLTAGVVVGGDTVDTSRTGTYSVTYNVSDAAGNAATEVTRTIVVEAAPDTTKPIITLVGEFTLTLTVGGTYAESGATATDEADGDLTTDIITGGDAVDTSTVGTYTVTYNVSDAAGNAATEVTRTVVVQAHAIFQDAEDVGNSWLLADWLGHLTNDSSHNGWSYHRELGWIYIANGSTSDDVWIYLSGSSIQGWFWTSDSMINLDNGLPQGFLYLVPDDGSTQAWHYLRVDSDSESSTFGSAFLYDFVANSWSQP